GEGKERGGGPAKEEGDRVRHEGAGPAEIPLYVTVALELGVAFRGQCANEENPEEKEDDAANLAGERRLRRPIVPVPARVS
ncbi:MAG TPA: hypothetical protein VK491_06170, partial [Gemmatimonadaceae bacterium]|nr:hypothetical protein [Gemmatimonadaceae bacterium]